MGVAAPKGEGKKRLRGRTSQGRKLLEGEMGEI